MNYFDPKDTAERYAKGRPYFHPNTIKHIKDFLKVGKKFEKALDVACGTGLSTQALQLIAQKIHGIDTSSQMLKWITSTNDIEYSIASAEQIPFDKNEFDLITVSSGVHWFNINSFLNEAHRVLKRKSWLVLYDNYFTSKMKDVPAFDQWFPEVYLAKFQSPVRNNRYEWNNENLHPKNFDFIKEEQFENSIEFTKDKLVLYFTTQSNITAAIESGQYNYPEIEYWLEKELSQFFKNDTVIQNIQYGNWIKYIRKMD